MPAEKRDPLQERISRSRACIDRYMQLNSVTEEDMAARMHVTVKTIQNRRKHPEKMQLEDIWEMAQILKCPIGELAGGELPEEIIGRLIRQAVAFPELIEHAASLKKL